MFAVSDSKKYATDHPRLLDNEFWASKVFKFADLAARNFRTSSWETARGDPKGTDLASHIEPKLML
jgi:hypothetical protein